MSALLFLALPATRVAYVLLALLIGGESAGIPLPGETALITGSILASQGRLWLPLGSQSAPRPIGIPSSSASAADVVSP